VPPRAIVAVGALQVCGFCRGDPRSRPCAGREVYPPTRTTLTVAHPTVERCAGSRDDRRLPNGWTSRPAQPGDDAPLVDQQQRVGGDYRIRSPFLALQPSLVFGNSGCFSVGLSRNLGAPVAALAPRAGGEMTGAGGFRADARREGVALGKGLPRQVAAEPPRGRVWLAIPEAGGERRGTGRRIGPHAPGQQRLSWPRRPSAP
jgi:hypothetical protein